MDFTVCNFINLSSFYTFTIYQNNKNANSHSHFSICKYLAISKFFTGGSNYLIAISIFLIQKFMAAGHKSLTHQIKLTVCELFDNE